MNSLGIPNVILLLMLQSWSYGQTFEYESPIHFIQYWLHRQIFGFMSEKKMKMKLK